MVRLATGSINFASHFLSDETQFLSLSVAGSHGFAEVSEVVGEALLFLVDVQLFDVVDQFLLQAVLVVVHADGLFEGSRNLFADFGYTFHFVRLDILHQCFDVVQFFVEFLFEGSTFLNAEVGNLSDGLVNRLTDYTPFFFGQFLDVYFSQYIWHTE